jgi:hypothetical protein
VYLGWDALILAITHLKRDQTMLNFNRLLSIVFLSNALLLSAGQVADGPDDIKLGLVQFETLSVTDKGGTHSPFIAVRVLNQNNKVQSFGLSNEAGFLGMPLPPGDYCFDAFSKGGHALRMNRQPSDRCFSVKEGQFIEVGVGFRE